MKFARKLTAFLAGALIVLTGAAWAADTLNIQAPWKIDGKVPTSGGSLECEVLDKSCAVIGTQKKDVGKNGASGTENFSFSGAAAQNAAAVRCKITAQGLTAGSNSTNTRPLPGSGVNCGNQASSGGLGGFASSGQNTSSGPSLANRNTTIDTGDFKNDPNRRKTPSAPGLTNLGDGKVSGPQRAGEQTPFGTLNSGRSSSQSGQNKSGAQPPSSGPDLSGLIARHQAKIDSAVKELRGTVLGCVTPQDKALCKKDNGVCSNNICVGSKGNLDPVGLPCTNNVKCNNGAYEGFCFRGKCAAFERQPCESKGARKSCSPGGIDEKVLDLAAAKVGLSGYSVQIGQRTLGVKTCSISVNPVGWRYGDCQFSGSGSEGEKVKKTSNDANAITRKLFPNTAFPPIEIDRYFKHRWKTFEKEPFLAQLGNAHANPNQAPCTRDVDCTNYKWTGKCQQVGNTVKKTCKAYIRDTCKASSGGSAVSYCIDPVNSEGGYRICRGYGKVGDCVTPSNMGKDMQGLIRKGEL